MKSLLKNFDLSGRVALVTGGGGLLGREHGRALLELGATVYLTDFSDEALDRIERDFAGEIGENRLFAMKMDVSDARSIRTAEREIDSQGHFVEILLNNAAIDPKVKADGSLPFERTRLENFELESWDHQLAVGLTGAFLCSQVFGTRMAEREKGVILNVASDLSVIAPDQRIYRKADLPEHLQPVKPVTYSVIKAGLVGLTRYLATYWAGRGVRANALSPGGVYQNQPEEFVTKLTHLIPLGRMARVDEYRSAVQFLCSDASAYLNGQNIVMDGGRSVL